jgi:hypothetical protein
MFESWSGRHSPWGSFPYWLIFHVSMDIRLQWVTRRVRGDEQTQAPAGRRQIPAQIYRRPSAGGFVE